MDTNKKSQGVEKLANSEHLNPKTKKQDQKVAISCSKTAPMNVMV